MCPLGSVLFILGLQDTLQRGRSHAGACAAATTQAFNVWKDLSPVPVPGAGVGYHHPLPLSLLLTYSACPCLCHQLLPPRHPSCRSTLPQWLPMSSDSSPLRLLV